MKIRIHRDRVYRIEAGIDDGHAKLEGSSVALVRHRYHCGTHSLDPENGRHSGKDPNVVEISVMEKGRFLIEPVNLFFIEGMEIMVGRWFPVTGVRLIEVGDLPRDLEIPEVWL
ncbi:MAG TPA: hypothetical protein VF275_03600 [Gammaproteobacteria bacterium]